MRIDILINESQKKFLIVENLSDNFAKDTEKLFDLTKKILKQTSDQLKINLEFLLTWGASIGGFIGPLEQYLNGQYPNLSSTDSTLILTGVISILYYDNKSVIKKILQTIKDKGLTKEFLTVLTKGKEFKSVFLNFLKTLNITTHKISNIMSYTFIIPLLPMFYEMVQSGNISFEDAGKISDRLLGFGFLTISGVAVKELIEKIITKFSN